MKRLISILDQVVYREVIMILICKSKKMEKELLLWLYMWMTSTLQVRVMSLLKKKKKIFANHLTLLTWDYYIGVWVFKYSNNNKKIFISQAKYA